MIEARGFRAAGTVAGVAAVILMGVIGCTVVTDGRATSDAADAPVYRASVSASIAASEVTSKIRASERAAAATTRAVHAVCETLATSSAEAVSTVNSYVEAVNGAGDVGSAKQPAVDALNNSADIVERSITDAVTAELRDALNAWVAAARATATNIDTDSGPDEFNDSVNRVNAARQQALELCDAWYR